MNNKTLKELGRIASAVLMSVTFAAQAGDLCVDQMTGGDDSPSTLAEPKLTIGAAITAAVAGDVIHVADGTYTEYGLALNKAIAVTSNAASRAAVVVQAQSTAPNPASTTGVADKRVFTISDTEAVLRNLTVKNGTSGTTAVGIYLDVRQTSRKLRAQCRRGREKYQFKRQ